MAITRIEGSPLIDLNSDVLDSSQAGDVDNIKLDLRRSTYSRNKGWRGALENLFLIATLRYDNPASPSNISKSKDI